MFYPDLPSWQYELTTMNVLDPAVAGQVVHYRGPTNIPATRQGISQMISSMPQSQGFIQNGEHPYDLYAVPLNEQEVFQYDPIAFPFVLSIVSTGTGSSFTSAIFIKWPVVTVVLGNEGWITQGQGLSPLVDFSDTTSFSAYSSDFSAYELLFPEDSASISFLNSNIGTVFAHQATFTNCTFEPGTQLHVDYPTFVNTGSASVPEPLTAALLLPIVFLLPRRRSHEQ